jgi:uncharacterized membrane protein YphA (DoxX/SURF4 family)
MKKYFQQFLFGTSLNDNKLLNIAWLLFRVQIGLSIALHAGLPKLENGLAPGWFINQVSGLGFNFPSPSFWAAIAVWGEFAGGIFIALGFLTRFSALQLAFQFFVISFLWHDNPEPFTGMYFQHSLFWGFVLISFTGGGKYSLDKLIMKKQLNKMNINIKPAAALIALFFITASSVFSQPTVSGKDFEMTLGKWTGTLTYLDYTSGKPVTMPCNLTISKYKKNTRRLKLAYEYPNEPKANGKDAIVISADGKMIDDEMVVSIEVVNDTLTITTNKNGVDGNDRKKALLRHIYIIGKNILIKRKEVKFEGEENWILRNEFKMSRL